jgi:hypothetical protein
MATTPEQRAAAEQQYDTAEYDQGAVATYGSYCDAQDSIDGTPWKSYCPAEADNCAPSHNWCILKWCYIKDMEACKAAGGDPQKSDVFKTADGDGSLYFSYQTCGNENCYNEETEDGTVVDIWSDSGTIPKFASGKCPAGEQCGIIDGCKCLATTEAQRDAAENQYDTTEYDQDAVARYGASCDAQDSITGTPWNSYCPQDANMCEPSHNWCVGKWCYIKDMEACKAAGGDPQKSDVFKTAAGDGSLYFSYQTCGNENCYNEETEDGTVVDIWSDSGTIPKFSTGECPAGVEDCD